MSGLVLERKGLRIIISKIEYIEYVFGKQNWRYVGRGVGNAYFPGK